MKNKSTPFFITWVLTCMISMVIALTPQPDDDVTNVSLKNTPMEDQECVSREFTHDFMRSPSVCQLRLDFLHFSLTGPNFGGDCSVDLMSIDGAHNLVNFMLCGNATGQHLYLHYGNSDQISLKIRLTQLTSSYDFLVSFINCSGCTAHENSKGIPSKRFFSEKTTNSKNGNLATPFYELAPIGCSQYYTKLADIVQSFNYMPLPSSPMSIQSQINNQQYTVCVKMVTGSNSISWSPCTTSGSFSVSGAVAETSPSEPCMTDYVDIPGSDLGRHCGTLFPSIVTTIAQPYTMYVNFNDEEIYGTDLPVDPTTGCQIGFICIIDGIPGMGCNPGSTPPIGMCIPNDWLIGLSDFDNRGFCLKYSVSY